MLANKNIYDIFLQPKIRVTASHNFKVFALILIECHVISGNQMHTEVRGNPGVEATEIGSKIKGMITQEDAT